MAIIYREEQYKNFGKCLYIANELQEMRVTLDIGPRIISYNLCGKENLMFNDIDNLHTANDDEFQSVFGKGSCWKIYGGHRFWISPEEYPLSYYPDCESVEYKIQSNVFTFTPPVQKITGWQIAMEITFDEAQAKVSVNHILTNTTSSNKSGSIWAMSVTGKGGRAIQKMCDIDTGLLANRNLILWPYSDVTDKRFYMSKDYYALQQDVNSKTAFKFGTNNTPGKIICVNHGQIFKKEFTHVENALYPDNGCSTELYSCNNFLEVETLSPLYNFTPGMSVQHVENWTLYQENSTNFDDVVKYL